MMRTSLQTNNASALNKFGTPWTGNPAPFGTSESNTARSALTVSGMEMAHSPHSDSFGASLMAATGEEASK